MQERSEGAPPHAGLGDAWGFARRVPTRPLALLALPPFLSAPPLHRSFGGKSVAMSYVSCSGKSTWQ